MTLNIAPKIATEHRRQLVASILATRPRVTQREICVWLGERMTKGERAGQIRCLNPSTGRPYSLGTINGDVKVLRQEYREKTTQARDEWVARLLLDYEDMYLLARAQRQEKQARLVLADIRKLLGLDAPTRSEVTGAEGGPIEVAQKPDLTKLNDEELDALAAINRRLHGD
jgi:hypothetical protein